MLIPTNPSWLRVLFWGRGTTLKRTWLRLLLATLLAVAVTVAHRRYGLTSELSVAPFTVVGLALSIFLGFRNNTSYDRFWEGRKLWGALANTARTGARQVLTLCDADEARKQDLIYAIIGYVHSLRLHLRSQQDYAELAPFLPQALHASLPREKNPPIAILLWLGQQFRVEYDAGRVHAMHLPLLEATLEQLTNVQGGCERIKATPIPFMYTVLMHRVVFFYCFGLPFALVNSVGTFTPVVAAFVAYVFFGLDTLGEEIEDPFGLDAADLPLDAISRMIEVNLRQALAEEALPPLLEPVDSVLS